MDDEVSMELEVDVHEALARVSDAADLLEKRSLYLVGYAESLLESLLSREAP